MKLSGKEKFSYGLGAVVKLASGVAVLAASLCLAIFHIAENTDVSAAAAPGSIMGLRMTMTLLPMVGLGLAMIYFGKKFTLTDETVAEISRKLKGAAE